MKTLTSVVLGSIALGAWLPAFAGPDWQAIEQARQYRRAQVVHTEKPTPAEECAARRLILPLDHGPRAQTTPYLNEKRKAAFEAELKACKEAAAKGTTR